MILSDDLEPPFEDVEIDWRRAAIRLPHDMAPKKITQVLVEHSRGKVGGWEAFENSGPYPKNHTVNGGQHVSESYTTSWDTILARTKGMIELDKTRKRFDSQWLYERKKEKEALTRAQTAALDKSGEGAYGVGVGPLAAKDLPLVPWSIPYSVKEYLSYTEEVTCWFDYVGSVGVNPSRCSPYKSVVSRLQAILEMGK